MYEVRNVNDTDTKRYALKVLRFESVKSCVFKALFVGGSGAPTDERRDTQDGSARAASVAGQECACCQAGLCLIENESAQKDRCVAVRRTRSTSWSYQCSDGTSPTCAVRRPRSTSRSQHLCAWRDRCGEGCPYARGRHYKKSTLYLTVTL